MEKIAEAVNVLGEFCGVGDVENFAQLTAEKFDIAVLFSGSILAGGDVVERFFRRLKHFRRVFTR